MKNANFHSNIFHFLEIDIKRSKKEKKKIDRSSSVKIKFYLS